jgi:hypothetical protein
MLGAHKKNGHHLTVTAVENQAARREREVKKTGSDPG